MLDKPANQIGRHDIERLIEAKVPESERLEYKAVLNLQRDEEKREFVRDVTAFSNTFGGHLIFGLEEAKGLPTGSVPGIEIDDLNAFKLRIENMLRDSVEPRLFGHSILAIQWTNGRHVVVLAIPRCSNPPHRRHQDDFYARNSAGKYPLSVEQLRRLFALGMSTAEHVRRWVRERAYLVRSGEGTFPLRPDAPKLIVHTIPLSAVESGHQLSVGESVQKQVDSFIAPLAPGSGFNADGIFWSHSNAADEYVQLFRDGTFEYVSCGWSLPSQHPEYGDRLLPVAVIERGACTAVWRLLRATGVLVPSSPTVVAITLVGASSHRILRTNPWGFLSGAGRPLGKDPLLLPQVGIDSDELPVAASIAESELEQKVALKLKPAFDTLWQASGYPGSAYFSDEGWTPR